MRAPAGTQGDLMMKAFQAGAATLPPMFGEFLTPQHKARLLANDMEALIAWRRKRMASPGLEDILSTITVPTLLFAGAADPIHAQAETCAQLVPGARFASLPGLGHIAALCRSDLVLPHVTTFLAEL
jgi:pimeloyl-ACP methyl ester carboxylesterase